MQCLKADVRARRLTTMNFEIISRAEARRLGKTRYFTGTPCALGHIAERKSCDCHCVICSNADRLRRIAADKPKHFASIRQWKIGHADIVSARKRKWYESNKESVKQAVKRWREANRDKYRATNRNRRALNRAAEGFHTSRDVAEIRRTHDDSCAFCKVPLHGGGEIDHIVALAKGGNNWPSNLQLLCKSCNARKGTKNQAEFMRAKNQFASLLAS